MANERELYVSDEWPHLWIVRLGEVWAACRASEGIWPGFQIPEPATKAQWRLPQPTIDDIFRWLGVPD